MRRRLATLMFAALVGLAPAAVAQVPPQAQPVAATPAPSHRQGPSVETAQNTAALMQRTGGSLLQASLAAQRQPTQARLQAVSFFAVPEPQPRMLKKHDLVTIIIREQSEYKSKGKTESSKDASIDANIRELIKLSLSERSITSGGIANGPLSVRADARRDFQGEAQADRQDSFIARIGAEVVDVKPNGNVVLQARKRIQTDEEVQEFLMSGVARAEDVGIDNTILSTQLSDFDLKKTSSGVVRDGTKRGLGTRFLDFVNPF